MSRLERAVQYVAETSNAIFEEFNVLIEKTTSFAIPYGKRNNRIHLNEGERSSTSSANEESANEEDSSEETEASSNVTRITTRARVTYGLDRFKRNAMLIFAQIRSDPPDGCRFEKTTMEDLDMLLNTFTDFRFEVDIHVDMTCSQLANKCQEFFQRDFSLYGAVIVAVLTYEGTTGLLSAYDGRFSESVILQHLTNDLNPSLLAKPKMYITEANRFLGLGNPISLPIEEHQDVLGLHLAAVMSDGLFPRKIRPLSLLCDNINKMADKDDLVTILKKSVEDIKKTHGVFDMTPIELNNTFTKEMWLARS